MRKLFDLDPYRVPRKMLGLLPIEFSKADYTGILKEFALSLKRAEAEGTEAPMQRFFEKNPVALLSLINPHKSWVFPRVALQNALGGGLEPDFLICDWASLGPEWTL